MFHMSSQCTYFITFNTHYVHASFLYTHSLKWCAIVQFSIERTRIQTSVAVSNPVRVYATLYACTRVRVYACTRVRVYACTRVRVYACTRVRVYACTRVRVYACTRVRVYACTRVRVYACTRVRVYACTRVRVYACTRSLYYDFSQLYEWAIRNTQWWLFVLRKSTRITCNVAVCFPENCAVEQI